jgi:hypothetical protein
VKITAKNPLSPRLMVLVGLSVASISVPLYAQPVYYLPQVIDGATAGGSLRSTIVLTNLSPSTATVKMALTRDDGSPLTVNFPDLGSGSQFSVTLKRDADSPDRWNRRWLGGRRHNLGQRADWCFHNRLGV